MAEIAIINMAKNSGISPFLMLNPLDIIAADERMAAPSVNDYV